VQNIIRLALTFTVATAALLAPIAHADTYTVYVQTGSFDPNTPRQVGDFGTDAQVSLVMHGSEGDTEPIVLSTGRATDFDAGNLDVFTVEAPHVGSLSRLRIGHDDTGPSPDWYLEWVVVRNETTGEAACFQYHGWLGREDLLAKGSCYATLTPSAQPDPKVR
jgi:PLAT/LH2 domain